MINYSAIANNGGQAIVNNYEAPKPAELPGLQNPIIPTLKYYTPTHYETKLRRQLSAQTSLIKRLSINGIAGSGKTELAKHYLKQYNIDYPDNLTWIISAETTEQWQQNLRNWAENFYPRLQELLNAEKDLEKQKRIATQIIQKELNKTPWCIVVDNWDAKSGPSIGEIEYLLSIGCGTILITTQQEDSPFSDEICSLNLSQGFSEEDADLLLQNILAPLNTLLPELGDSTARKILVDALDRLPLALVQAGSYILWENKARQKQGTRVFTYENYRHLLQEKVSCLIEKQQHSLSHKADVPRENSNNIRVEFIKLKTQEGAVNLSLQKAINLSSEKPNMHLWQLLCFCGFLASDGIPQQLLKDYLRQWNTNVEEETLDSLWRDVIQEAQNYSLLQFEEKRSVIDDLFSLHIHRVVQRVLHDNFLPLLLEKLKSSINKFMMEALLLKFEPAVDKQVFGIIRAYLPHVESLWHALSLSTEVKNNILTYIPLQGSLASVKQLLGNYKEVVTLRRKILAIKVTCYGPTDIEITTSLGNLATALEKLDCYEEALMLSQQALEIRIAYYGTEAHVKVADAQHNLATMLEAVDRYQEAETLFRKVLANKMIIYGTREHARVADTVAGLALTLQKLGRYDEAATLHREALATKIQSYGTSHICVADAQANLATVLLLMHFYNEAKIILEEALITQSAHYGTEAHINVAGTQSSLAFALVTLGSYKESEELARKALAMQTSYYGTTLNFNVAGTQQCLATSLQAQGHYKESEKLFRESLTTLMKYYKTTSHTEVAKAQYQLASVLEELECCNEAEELYRKALTTKINHCGEKHAEVANVQQNLAIVLTKTKRYEEAEILYRKALAIKIDYYGTEKHMDVAITQHNLAKMLSCVSRNQEAFLLIDTAVRTFQTQEGSLKNLEEAQKLKQHFIGKLNQARNNNSLFSIDKGSSPSYEREKALRLAADAGDLAAVISFIDNNDININAEGPESGKTALHRATQKKSYAIVQALIDAGADLRIADRSGKYAVDYAEGDERLRTMLSSYMSYKK